MWGLYGIIIEEYRQNAAWGLYRNLIKNYAGNFFFLWGLAGRLGASGAWWWGVPGGTPRRLQGGFIWSPHLESLGDLYLEGPTGVQRCAKWVQQRLCTGGFHDEST